MPGPLLQLYEKGDSDTDVFSWILRNYQEHLFSRTPLEVNFCKWMQGRVSLRKTSIVYQSKRLFSVSQCLIMLIINLGSKLEFGTYQPAIKYSKLIKETSTFFYRCDYNTPFSSCCHWVKSVQILSFLLVRIFPNSG